MRPVRVMIALLIAGLTLSVTSAQQTAPSLEREHPKADRGDARAEALLKRAYTRVHSAEAGGLKKLRADADIEVDLSFAGAGKIALNGDMLWKAGEGARWRGTGEMDGNPMAPFVDALKSFFEPYLVYLTGFEAWDSRFRDAAFKLLEPPEEDEGNSEEDGPGRHIEVTFGDKRVEVFVVKRNRIVTLTADSTINKTPTATTFTFEYEDLGDRLRPAAVTGEARVDNARMPGGNDLGPQTLRAAVRITKWSKVGEHEVAATLEGEASMTGLPQALPVSLVLSRIRTNEEVDEEGFENDPSSPDEKPGVPQEEDF